MVCCLVSCDWCLLFVCVDDVIVVCWLLFVVRCLPHVDCLVLFGVCCVLCVVDCRLSFVVCCVSAGARCVCSLSFVVYRLLCGVVACCSRCVVWFLFLVV